MSDTKYTPGPWISDKYGVITGGPDKTTTICETTRINWINQLRNSKEEKQRLHAETQLKQAEANGDLITASPDLLEACKQVLSNRLEHRFHETYHAFDESEEILRQAIAKAEGKD